VGWAAAHKMPDMMQFLLAAGTHLDGGNIANQVSALFVKTVLALYTGRHEDALLADAAAAGRPADISNMLSGPNTLCELKCKILARCSIPVRWCPMFCCCSE
jgi:hypothetical protein